MLDSLLVRSWHSEFEATELAEIRAAIPAAVQASHVRSARAHVEYDDPDGDQYVYGAGMSRGVVKELESRLEHLPSFRRLTVEGSNRKLTQVGHVLLFSIRVGKKMPRDRSRIRLSYLPDVRRDILHVAGMTKYQQAPLDGLHVDADDSATQEDALKHIAGVEPESLIVPYFSSDPYGIGSVCWGPARLVGKYLNFSEPETLTYVSMPNEVPAPSLNAGRAQTAFANGERPATKATLRADRRNE